jgi:hypothetical protein
VRRGRAWPVPSRGLRGQAPRRLCALAAPAASRPGTSLRPGAARRATNRHGRALSPAVPGQPLRGEPLTRFNITVCSAQCRQSRASALGAGTATGLRPFAPFGCAELPLCLAPTPRLPIPRFVRLRRRHRGQALAAQGSRARAPARPARLRLSSRPPPLRGGSPVCAAAPQASKPGAARVTTKLPPLTPTA